MEIIFGVLEVLILLFTEWSQQSVGFIFSPFQAGLFVWIHISTSVIDWWCSCTDSRFFSSFKNNLNIILKSSMTLNQVALVCFSVIYFSLLANPFSRCLHSSVNRMTEFLWRWWAWDLGQRWHQSNNLLNCSWKSCHGPTVPRSQSRPRTEANNHPRSHRLLW